MHIKFDLIDAYTLYRRSVTVNNWNGFVLLQGHEEGHNCVKKLVYNFAVFICFLFFISCQWDDKQFSIDSDKRTFYNEHDFHE